jgi:hypothetical protein
VEYDYSNLPKLSVGDIMDLFTNMEDSAAEYLLFLQNVVSIELRVSGEEQNVKAEILSTTREYRIDTAKALPKVRTSGRGGSADLCHFTEIVHSNRKNSSTKLRWCISQCLPNALQDYDKIGDSEPRVGIAALISIDDETFDHKKSPFCGRLFDRLSSSTTEQPVHIYGEFSSNSDLYQRPENSNAGDCSSQLWNTAIPYALVAHAWSTFLLDISPQLIAPVGIQVTPESERYFSYWPRRAKEGKLSALVESIYHHTFSYILLENLPLWPTASGRKGIKDIFVCRMVDITILRAVEQRHLQGLYQLHAALLQLELPLAYLPEEIYDTIGSLWPDRKILTPVALSVFLTNHGGEVQHFSDATKGALLNYLMSRPLDEKFDHLIGIPLIPTCDGQWRALEYLSSLKFPANEREMSLFNKRPEINVDFRRLPSRVFRKLKVLQTNKLSELLQPWLVGDLPEYLRSAYFANITEDRLSIDASELESGFGHFVRELWQWIIEQAECSDVVGHLENLWLIPIADGSYQRVANAVDAAEDIVSLPLDATGSPLGDFMLSIKDKFNHPISILETSFQRDAAKLLKSYNRVWDSSNLSHVLSWLSYNSNAIPPLSSSLKEQLSQHLVELAHCHISGGSFPQGFRGSIRNLAIFKEACNTMDGIVINWVSLRRVCQYVVVCMDLAVPEIPNVVFLHCGCGATRELLKMFNLAESPDIPTLLSQYVIPALSSGMPTYIVERLGRYVLDNFSCLTRSDIDILRHIQFIPARTMDDTIRRLVLPSKCVDRHSETRSLYLERECVWVDDSVLMGYAVPLSVLGMVQSVTIELVLERVSYYIFSASKIQVKDIAARAEALILACVNMEIISSMRFREGKWLPAWSHDGELCLQSPPSCRDKSLREIAGFAMAIVPFDVGPNWSAAFGWTETPVQPKYIRAQIQALTVQKDVISLEKVLEYVANRNGYAEVLKDLAWIPSQSGVYFCPSDIFFDDFIRLEPRCSTIKSSLLKYEDFLRKTGVMERPSFEKLYEITAILGTGEFPLEGEDLEMAITICSIATSLYPESNYRGFKVPDWNGVLVDMALLVADAPHLCEGVVRFVHPSVPEDVKKTMRIPSLSDTCPPESVTEVRQTLSPTEPSAIQLNGPREKERLDSIKETLSKYRAEDALSILLSYVDTLEGASCVEWRLEDVTIIGTESEPVVCPKLFLITDGGVYVGPLVDTLILITS